MYVKEFLEFIGNLYNVKNVKERVKEMIETTGLQIEQNKKLSNELYKQSVAITFLAPIFSASNANIPSNVAISNTILFL